MNKALDAVMTRWLQDHREEFISDLLGLIAIPSVKEEPVPDCPYGEPVGRALSYMLSLCDRAGLTTRNIGGRCAEATREGGETVVGVLTHLDIVPAGDGWTRNPWGELSGERIYGRGVIDNKGPALASLYALRALTAAGAPVANSLRLIFGGDEECGMDDMRYYLTKRPAPDYAFSPDARFPVIHAEKGIVSGEFYADITAPTTITALSGGTRSNVVPAAAQASLKGLAIGRLSAAVEQRTHIMLVVENGEILIRSEGVSAHASTPHKGRNAAVQLIEYLADTLPEEDGALPRMRALADGSRMATDGSGLSIACRDAVSGALTFNLGKIAFDGRRLTLTYDIRHPVTLDIDETLKKMEQSLGALGFTMAPAVPRAGLYLPASHPLVATLTRVYTQCTGRRSRPVAIGGGTYARTLPCAVAFGPIFPGQPENAHMADEYARVGDLLSAARIFAHAMLELGNLPPNG
jgi:succinyl-diaminopimelate desuccinylase